MDTIRFYNMELLGDADIEERPCLEHLVEEMEPEGWRLHDGTPIAPLWPTDARIYLTGEEFGLELCDLVGTTRNVIIAGGRLKETIQSHCAEIPIEYLPIAIHDHRKRLLAAEYFIVNPLGAHDCLDLDKSQILWKNGPGSEILAVNEAVIDRERGARAPQLFRLEHERASYVLRYDLALAIKEAKFTNIVWSKLEVSG